MCVFFNETYIPVYRKMVSSEIRDFLKGLFYASQPIGKLNFKLSIPVQRKQKNKNTGKYRATTGTAAS